MSDKCFGSNRKNGCNILTVRKCQQDKCSFYKSTQDLCGTGRSEHAATKGLSCRKAEARQNRSEAKAKQKGEAKGRFSCFLTCYSGIIRAGDNMPRRPRERSETGIYHIMVRGANRQEIFHDDSDRLRFLEILNRVKITSEMQVYGWCLMNNHVHLLLKEGSSTLAGAVALDIMMKRYVRSFF